MKIYYAPYTLKFRVPAVTSRSVISKKTSWFLYAKQGERFYIGECSLLEGLSYDDTLKYEDTLRWVCKNSHLTELEMWMNLSSFPSIQFGVEQLKKSLLSDSPMELYPSSFTEGKAAITINGLIWMGSIEVMSQQIKEKVSQGFTCIKLKIGAQSFKRELDLIRRLRRQFSEKELQIRVDANGAFSTGEVLSKLEQLSRLDVHSIEQPIRPKQLQEMAKLCEDTPLPIALDEELIGVISQDEKKQILETIKPQYIILKPSLLGGFRGAQQWIDLAHRNGIGWWITSALESDIGLSAIAQWTYTTGNLMPQGLGTGGLFSNNFQSPLMLKSDKLTYEKGKSWHINLHHS